MLTCPKCRAPYRVQRSIELQQSVRNLCKCELGRVCGFQKKGKRPCGDVRQALLDPDNMAEFYVCEAHAAQDSLDDPAISPPKESKAKAKAEPYKEINSVEGYASMMSNLDYPTICLLCKSRYPLNRRVVRQMPGEGKPVFDTHCPNPKCDAATYAASGPPWEQSYMSAHDYDNPPEEKEPPKPAPTPKKKRK